MKNLSRCTLTCDRRHRPNQEKSPNKTTSINGAARQTYLASSSRRAAGTSPPLLPTVPAPSSHAWWSTSWNSTPPRTRSTSSWTTSIYTPQIVDRLLRRAEGRRYLGWAQRALHAETRKLARSGGDRTEHVLAAMPGHAEDSGSGDAEAGNQGLEPEGQSETDQDQLAVHEKEGQEGVQVRGALPQGLNTGYGWPECYYDAVQGKLVLAPEYGGDGGKKVGPCATKIAPIAAFPAHWAPNAMTLYDKQQFPAHYRHGVFIAFHGSWDRAPYPQGGYKVVFQALAGDHASGQCEIFADGFAGAVQSPGQAEHRPSGLAVGPDGSLFVSDDVRGRIYRIVYRGGSGSAGGAPPYTACPSALAPAGNVSANDAKPPEGTHPDAGAADDTAGLPVPAGATKEM